MTKWLYLIGAIVLEVGGTLSLRLSVDSAIWFVGVGIGYVGAFACLTLLLRAGAPIGLTYGVWAASGVALTAVLASVLFGEPRHRRGRRRGVSRGVRSRGCTHGTATGGE